MNDALRAGLVVAGLLGFTFGGVDVAYAIGGYPGMVGAAIGTLSTLLALLCVVIGTTGNLDRTKK